MSQKRQFTAECISNMADNFSFTIGFLFNLEGNMFFRVWIVILLVAIPATTAYAATASTGGGGGGKGKSYLCAGKVNEDAVTAGDAVHWDSNCKETNVDCACAGGIIVEGLDVPVILGFVEYGETKCLAEMPCSGNCCYEPEEPCTGLSSFEDQFSNRWVHSGGWTSCWGTFYYIDNDHNFDQP